MEEEREREKKRRQMLSAPVESPRSQIKHPKSAGNAQSCCEVVVHLISSVGLIELVSKWKPTGRFWCKQNIISIVKIPVALQPAYPPNSFSFKMKSLKWGLFILVVFPPLHSRHFVTPLITYLCLFVLFLSAVYRARDWHRFPTPPITSEGLVCPCVFGCKTAGPSGSGSKIYLATPA